MDQDSAQEPGAGSSAARFPRPSAVHNGWLPLQALACPPVFTMQFLWRRRMKRSSAGAVRAKER
eukprot:12146312-Alexandrium_andersonii.AAC.1